MFVHEAQKFQKAIVGMSLDDIKKKLPVSKTPKLPHPCPLSAGHDRNLNQKIHFWADVKKKTSKSGLQFLSRGKHRSLSCAKHESKLPRSLKNRLVMACQFSWCNEIVLLCSVLLNQEASCLWFCERM